MDLYKEIVKLRDKLRAEGTAPDRKPLERKAFLQARDEVNEIIDQYISQIVNV